ncbi:MAG: phosphoribosylglycinamide formyltransferase [Phycisphaerales bacterium]|nr:phosphoribosylglycinamide formyltransferase [Phycisphaerales bacterium]
MPPRLAVLLSGSGRTLVNLLDHIDSGALKAAIPLVIASRECVGAQRARDRGVPAVLVVPGTIPAATLATVLDEHRIDWVVLAGYLKLVEIPPAYRGLVVNIHPALLPDFGGPGMHGRHVHEAVLAARRTQSGCTVHLCDEVYDRGRVILQKRCPVLPDDTPETLAARVFELEKAAYPEALARLLEGTMYGDGKNTPCD